MTVRSVNKSYNTYPVFLVLPEQVMTDLCRAYLLARSLKGWLALLKHVKLHQADPQALILIILLNLGFLLVTDQCLRHSIELLAGVLIAPLILVTAILVRL